MKKIKLFLFIFLVLPSLATAGWYYATGLQISDTFNRTDSDSLGDDWTEAAGDWDIVSNECNLITTGSNSYLIFSGVDTASVNQYVYVKFVDWDPANDYLGLVVRYTDAASGFYVVFFHGTGYEWVHYASVGGASTAIGSGGTTITDGESIGMTVYGTGANTEIRIWDNPTNTTPYSISYWDNGSDTADVVNTSDPSVTANTGSRVGLMGYAASTAPRFDNFYGGSR